MIANLLLAKEQAKRNDHLEDLKALWLRTGGLGLHWKPGSEADLEDRWSYLVRAGQRLTASSVAKHVTAWACWETWVKGQLGAHSTPLLFTPDPVDVARFLDHETQRGPSLGRARLQSLVWLRKRLGIAFPVTDVLLADFANAPVGHSAKQA